MIVASNNKLSVIEKTTLVECEKIVDKGLKTFVEVGSALLTIRNQKLYRTTDKTFELYLERRFKISRKQGYRLMDAAITVNTLKAAGIPEKELPKSEGAARVVAKKAKTKAKANGKKQAVSKDLVNALKETKEGKTGNVKVVPNSQPKLDLKDFENEVSASVKKYRKIGNTPLAISLEVIASRLRKEVIEFSRAMANK